jgi:hypothetical protein
MTEANSEATGSQPYRTTAETAQNPSGGDDSPPNQPEELRQEIQETREELEETVEALAQKADVKTQARTKITEGKQALRDKAEQIKDKASELGQKAQHAAPDQAQQALGQAIAEARQRPISAGMAFLLGLLLGLIFKKGASRTTQRKHGWQQVLTAVALQGAVLSVAKAAVDRGSAEGLRKLMSAWSGD